MFRIATMIMLSLFSALSGVTLAETVALPRTGQAQSYASGDDGALQRGRAWPGQRFASHGNGTVTDNLTGLMWAQDANLMASRDPGYAANDGNGHVTWQQALDYVQKLNSEQYLGYSDWRLPNRKELRSLVDYSRYNPALPAGHPFSNVQSFWYWSSTTSVFYTGSAWVVFMWDGYVSRSSKSSGDFYVWPVRGGRFVSTGYAGISDTLQITTDGTNPLVSQAAGTAFTVTVRAVDANGKSAAGFYGPVTLHASSGTIRPNTVSMVNGTGSENVTVDSAGACVKITAHGQGVSGESAPFTVTGGSGSTVKLGGTVTDGAGLRLDGVTVTLTGCSGQQTHTVTNAGNFQFAGLAPGNYTVQAGNNTGGASAPWDGYVSNEQSPSIELVLPGSTCNPSGKTPVLLVPGTMGSSVGYPVYPLLTAVAPPWQYEKWHTDTGGLHDPYSQVGWRELMAGLASKGYEKGCTLFPVPYDWRMPIDKASREYLEKVISRAKSAAGSSRVNIISHSMGGLVTRSYLQSGRYDNDIDKFAMVGTPNHGSAQAYYLWEGGNPSAVDDAKPVDTNTIDWLHASMYNSPLFDVPGCINCPKIRKFIHDEAKSVRDLLPTDTFLADDSHSFGLDKEKNDTLVDLNGGYTAATFPTKGITPMTFAGDQTDTISVITVAGSNERYVDGAPRAASKISSGDGTVLQTSAHLAGVSLSLPLKKAEHSQLIKLYKDEIISFITGSAAASSSVARSSSGPMTVTAGPTVTLSLQGRVSPEITDPSGNKSGNDPATGLRENAIPGSRYVLDQGRGGINMENAANGTYTVTLGGPVTEDYRLFLSYMDGATTVTKNLLGFHNGAATTFTVTVDNASSARLTVNRYPQPPTMLQAEAMGSAPQMTRLSWAASPDAGVTGYNVYSRASNEPTLAKIGTTAGTTYDPSDPWADDASPVSHFYAVSAIAASGAESFLTELAENRAYVTADFGADKVSGTAPLTVTFADKSTGYITGRQWEFDGDGAIDSTDTNPVHTFTAPGTYPVTLTLSGPGTAGSLTRSDYIVVNAPLSLGSVTATPPSPRMAGTNVTFTATASGGSGSYQYQFWLRAAGGTWTMAQAYGSSPSWSWNTTGLAAGTYAIQVWARNAGSTASYETYKQVSYTLAPPAAAVAVTSNPASPRPAGTTVTFTAASSGGSGSYQYQFWLRAPGGTWAMARAYNSNATWTWSTAGLAAGTYAVQVWARNAGSTVSYEAYQQVSYTLAPPAAAVAVTSNPASPRPAGTTVTFTASASGGSGSYQYQFWLRAAGGTWTMAQAYGSSPSWSWNTTGLAAGTYSIQVWARNSGSTASYEAYQQVSYVLAAPVSSVSLTVTPDSPRPVMTDISFTASASGGSGSYQYQFYLRPPGGTWAVAQAYSSSDTWNWNTSGLSSGIYAIQVWARNAGSTTSYEAYKSFTYTLSP